MSSNYVSPYRQQSFSSKYSNSYIPSTITDFNNETVTFDDFFKIVIVLDESGSMITIKKEMIKAINDLILEQKQVKGKQTTFTLVKFNDKVNRVIKNKNLNDTTVLTNGDYTPSGPTALYDAIGDTINWFRNESDVLMVIVTDGQENSSKQYTKCQVHELIDEKKNTKNWSYVYLSSDLETYTQGNNIGFKKSSYSSNCAVNQRSFGRFVAGSLNSAIGNYRSKGISVQSQLNK